MNTELTITTVLWGIIVLLIAVVTGAGIVPLLKSGTGYFEAKKEMALKAIVGIDAQFAETTSLPQVLINDLAAGIHVSPTTPAVVASAQVLAEALKALNKILPETPDEIDTATIARAANDVARFVERLTNNIAGDALPTSKILDGVDTSAG